MKKLNNYRSLPTVFLWTIILSSTIYFIWWLDYRHIGNWPLYILLLLGEIYHIFHLLGYSHTVHKLKEPPHVPLHYFPPVDVFITVCGEPVEVVEKTLTAAVNIDYPNFKVYILNDGKVAKKDNWREIDALAVKHGAIPLTRSEPGGFKAGNVNRALERTNGKLVAIFDADHIPEPNFLIETVGHFEDPKIGLVQTPQYYVNKDENFVTKSAWEQQELFFGPICVGKNKSNSAFWCGTNAVVRRTTLESIGGVPENNIAEDFLASLFMHSKGWKTLYLPLILAKGLAPHNLRDYVTQQFRWARGSLDVLFKYNPLFIKGLTAAQRFQYLFSSTYYLNGVIIIVDAIIPLIALFFGIQAVQSGTGSFVLVFLPFIFSTLFLLVYSTKSQLTFNAVQFSSSLFYVFLVATISILFSKNAKFNVTPKNKVSGNFLQFAIPHLLYVAVGSIAIYVAVARDGLSTSVLNNASWVLFNSVFFTAFIAAAYPWKLVFSRSHKVEPVSEPALERVDSVTYDIH